MNKEFLEAKLGELLAYFAAEGRSKYMYKHYCDVGKQVLLSWEKYGDLVFEEMIAHTTQSGNGCTQWRRVNLIRNIQRFTEQGIFPPVLNKNRYKTLTPTYRKVVDRVVKSLKNSSYAEKTIDNYKNLGISFFDHLQTNGAIRISLVTSDNVERYFYEDGQPRKCSSIAKQLRRFLQVAYQQTRNQYYLKAYSYIPEIRLTHNVYPILSSDESTCIETVLLDDKNGLSCLDRAIGLLAFYTGLRSCDITHLQYTDIDWHRNLLSMTQQKTKKPISIKLEPVFGNALYDYITKERPQVKSPYIFLKKNTHEPLNRHDTYKITINILYKAKVRMIEGRRGIHLLRHNLATSMVNHNTDFAIISAALGHTNPRTVLDYMDSSVDRLKSCALTIPTEDVHLETNVILLREIEYLKYMEKMHNKSAYQYPSLNSVTCPTLPIKQTNLYRRELNMLMKSLSLIPINFILNHEEDQFNIR